MELVLAAAAAGLHVICQKPLARTVEEASKMVKACSKAGVQLIVHENWRFQSASPPSAFFTVLTRAQQIGVGPIRERQLVDSSSAMRGPG